MLHKRLVIQFRGYSIRRISEYRFRSTYGSLRVNMRLILSWYLGLYGEKDVEIYRTFTFPYLFPR